MRAFIMLAILTAPKIPFGDKISVRMYGPWTMLLFVPRLAGRAGVPFFVHFVLTVMVNAVVHFN